MGSSAQPHSYYVGERVEAVMGSRGLVVGGSIMAENEDGTYAVEFDNGYEYDSLDGSKLAPEVSQQEELQVGGEGAMGNKSCAAAAHRRHETHVPRTS